MAQGNCKNCGADKGLHHYATGQCPINGVEAPIGRKQGWSFETYQPEDDTQERIASLAASNAVLLEALKEAEKAMSEAIGQLPNSGYGWTQGVVDKALIHTRAAIAQVETK